ncbi:hypothetical protein [Hydrogenophaga atypica]
MLPELSDARENLNASPDKLGCERVRGQIRNHLRIGSPQQLSGVTSMFEPKRLTSAFKWIAPEKRKSRFGPMPPRKAGTRSPWLWLARLADELYLVNESEEVLERVSASPIGWLRIGHEEGVTPLNQPTPCIGYHGVPKCAAVKVAEYDDFYDLDFDLGVSLVIQSQRMGCVELQTPLSKGGVQETVLLWDNGDTGPGVHMNPR